MKEEPRGPLPFMKTLDDAAALCQKEQDTFYVTAFMIEAWLGRLVLKNAEEYAEKKNAKDRAMQTGESWRIFNEIFGHAQDNELSDVLGDLLRFAEYDDVQSRILCRAYYPISLEHEYSGDFIGPKTMDVARRPVEGILLLRRTLERWSEWLDAVTHFDIHAHRHLAPVCFDPDPEKRELASLGVNQLAFAQKDEYAKAWWEWHHSEAAGRFKNSPKWATVGKAMASIESSRWAYPQLDEVVIYFWPLMKRHNWTYSDLRNVLRLIVPRPDAYPCEREQDLAAYCSNVLGLRKKGQGKTAKNGRPAGFEVALRLCGRTPPAS